MTYWVYNPQSMKEKEEEGKPDFDVLEYCEQKGLLIFHDYIELKMRQNDDKKYFNHISHITSVQKENSWHDELVEADLTELLNLKNADVDPNKADKPKADKPGRKKGYKRSNNENQKIIESKKEKANEFLKYDLEFDLKLAELKHHFKMAKRLDNIQKIEEILDKLSQLNQ